jgi:hypothetical protein
MIVLEAFGLLELRFKFHGSDLSWFLI